MDASAMHPPWLTDPVRDRQQLGLIHLRVGLAAISDGDHRTVVVSPDTREQGTPSRLQSPAV